MIHIQCRTADIVLFSSWKITRGKDDTGPWFCGSLNQMPSDLEMDSLVKQGVPFFVGNDLGKITFGWISDGATLEHSTPTGSVEENLPYRLAVERLDAVEKSVRRAAR